MVEGLETVLNNLNREIGNIEGRTLGGLFEGGLIVQRTAQKRVPVDTGNLKGSAYTRKDPAGRIAVEVGFTAAYAVYVHEDLEAKHPVGRSKYLQSAVTDHEQDILNAVHRRAKVS